MKLPLLPALLLLATVPQPILAQTGSIDLFQVDVEFEGVSYAFLAGQDNVFAIERAPSFLRRRADFTVNAAFTAAVGAETVRIIPSCTVSDPILGEGASQAAFDPAFYVLDPNGPMTSVNVPNAILPNSQFQISQPPSGDGTEIIYTVQCRLVTSLALDQPFAESAPITFRQVFGGQPQVKITKAEPDPSQKLPAGADQVFTADIEFALPEGQTSGQLRLGMVDPESGDLIGIGPLIELTSQMGTVQATLFVAIPNQGPVALKAFLAGADGLPLTQSAEVLYAVAEDLPDYSIWHIEAIQVVQDIDNLIPLLADKKTLVRVFVRTPPAAAAADFTSLPAVNVEVVLRNGDKALPPVTKQIKAIVAPDGSQPVRERRETHTSVEMLVPAEMLRPGTLVVDAKVNLADGDPIEPELNPGNNARSQQFILRERDPLLIRWANDQSEGSTTPEFLPNVFPVSPTRGFSYRPMLVSTNRDSGRPVLQFILALIVSISRLGDGLTDALVAWHSDPRSRLRGVSTPRFIQLVDRPRKSDQVNLAAQVARAFLLSPKDEVCAAAVSPGFEAVGWDAVSSRLVVLEFHSDLVGSCAENIPGTIWISPERYVRLFLRDFTPRPPIGLMEEGSPMPGQEMGDLIVVAGEVNAIGGSLVPVVRVQGVQGEQPASQGAYCVNLMGGAAGTQRNCFTPDFSEVSANPFAFAFPDDPAITKINLTVDGVEAAALEASASAPTVAISAPTAGAELDAADPVTLAWTASDPDGDSLTATAFYSFDGGSAWLPLDTGIAGESLTFDASQLYGGDNVLFRVSVSDGLRTAESIVGPVNLIQSPGLTAPATVDAGESAVGLARQVSIPIQITGTGVLEIQAATSDNPAFAPLFSLPAQFLSDTNSAITVDFTPPATGSHQGTLTLTTNSSDSPIVRVRLDGIGLDPKQGILDIPGVAEGLIFGGVAAESADTAVVSLVNRSEVVVNVDVAIEGDAFGLEAQTAALREAAPQQNALSLRPKEQLDLIVSFVPPTVGDFAGKLRVASDAPNLTSVTIPLSGEGIEATVNPTINAGGVVDAAGFGPALSRGGITSLFGTNLSPSTEIATTLPLPTSFNGVEVRVDGVPAPLFFTSANQINFQMPFEAPLSGPVEIEVVNSGLSSGKLQATVQPYAPAVFANPATGEPIITRHPDGALITAANPARPGDVLIVFVTGIGDVSNAPASGDASPSSPLASAAVLPAVTIGDAPTQVFFGGLAPFFVGLGQVNIQLPDPLPEGDAVLPLVISFDGNAGMPVQIPVSRPGS